MAALEPGHLSHDPQPRLIHKQSTNCGEKRWGGSQGAQGLPEPCLPSPARWAQRYQFGFSVLQMVPRPLPAPSLSRAGTPCTLRGWQSLPWLRWALADGAGIPHPVFKLPAPCSPPPQGVTGAVMRVGCVPAVWDAGLSWSSPLPLLLNTLHFQSMKWLFFSLKSYQMETVGCSEETKLNFVG